MKQIARSRSVKHPRPEINDMREVEDYTAQLIKEKTHSTEEVRAELSRLSFEGTPMHDHDFCSCERELEASETTTDTTDAVPDNYKKKSKPVYKDILIQS